MIMALGPPDCRQLTHVLDGGHAAMDGGNLTPADPNCYPNNRNLFAQTEVHVK